MAEVATRVGLVDYAEAGSGSPLVLLHATLHDRRDFDPIVERLAAHHRVIAVDWPGHGASPMPESTVTGPLLADVLEDVVTELALEAAVFVGNSVGGFAAARLAITNPDRVAGLVLVNAAGFSTQNAATRTFCRTVGVPAVARRVLPRLVPMYMRSRGQADREITGRVVARARTPEGASLAAGLWRSFADPTYDLRERAGEVTCPTLLLWGARDPIVPLREGRATLRALSDARLEAFPTGHVVFSSDPTAFLAALLPFLGEVLADGRSDGGGCNGR